MSAYDRRLPGNDSRIVTFRGALESLLESLDATVRIARWQEGDGEPVPEALQQSAVQLQVRLGSATRLAAGKFAGTAAVVEKSDAIKEAVRDLDTAFVAYRKRLDGALSDRDEAALDLDAVVGRVKHDAHRWE
ncbi:MAG TPA: hypothetical protein VMI75_04360 [Polyangiaceae bacterium]|nr:hypothetical protein [Polyangiaceae bacterium]